MPKRMAVLRGRLERLALWRVWERMLEIEFVDRSVALAGKAFVSLFPLVIVVAAFLPEGPRSSIISTVTFRLGMRGDALSMAQDAFASSDDIRQATGLLGLVMTILYASSFATALQRVYLRSWRRRHPGGVVMYGRAAVCLLAVSTCAVLLAGVRGAVEGGIGVGLLVIASLAVTSALWWFIAWFLLMGDVRARVLVPTGMITGLATALYGASASIWMPPLVTSNEAQFGFFGVALSLVTWFSGAAICVLFGACAGVVLAEDDGRVGRLIRGDGSQMLTAHALPSLPPPTEELRLRDVFRSTDDDP